MLKKYNLLLIIIILEALSFFSFNHSILHTSLTLIIAFITIIFTIYRLEYGLIIVFSELLLGVQGHLFMAHIFNTNISLRLLMWGIILIVFVIKLIYQKAKGENNYLDNIKSFSFSKEYLYLLIFVIWGVVSAFIYKNNFDNIFFDFNAWLYFLLLFPLLAVYHHQGNKNVGRLLNVLKIIVIWISIKTLILLFIFTHNIGLQSLVYSWLRRTITGEMTATIGGWPRIFIQSQIFPIIAYFFVLWSREIKEKKKFLTYIIPASLLFSTLIISFSRSFWLAFSITILVLLIIIWEKSSFVKMIKTSSWIAISIVLAFSYIIIISNFPISRTKSFNINIAERINNAHESAIVSRWSLWSPLMDNISHYPLGHGYGSAITYISSDPRVLSTNPDGRYTSYAFEWGYLGIWLKIGILGLLAYLYLLFRLLITSKRTNNDLMIPIFLSLIFIIIVNFFTPYLNHPLGIGLILLTSCLISKNRVYWKLYFN